MRSKMSEAEERSSVRFNLLSFLNLETGGEWCLVCDEGSLVVETDINHRYTRINADQR